MYSELLTNFSIGYEPFAFLLECGLLRSIAGEAVCTLPERQDGSAWGNSAGIDSMTHYSRPTRWQIGRCLLTRAAVTASGAIAPATRCATTTQSSCITYI